MGLPTLKRRRPLDDKYPRGYLESDVDYVMNNLELAVILLAKFEESLPDDEGV